MDFGTGTATTHPVTGEVSFSFTAPFPRGVFTVIPRPADGSGKGYYYEVLQANTTNSQFDVQVYTAPEGGLALDVPTTAEWIAFGF